jgi:hypothetical protein
MKFACIIGPLLASGIVIACGSSSSQSSGATRVPKRHRPTHDVCGPTDPPLIRPYGIRLGQVCADIEECTTDADCTQGLNGHCAAYCGHRCGYDECALDSDCQHGVCGCKAGLGGTKMCISSTCLIDADCPNGGYCSPSEGDCGNYAGDITFACHNATDECIDDDDCATFDAGNRNGSSPSCRYDPTLGHWKCSATQCSG